MARTAFRIIGGLMLAVGVLPAFPVLLAEGARPGVLAIGKTAGQEWSGNGLSMKLCWCPPGKFQMGSPKDEPDRVHGEGHVAVTLTRGFWIGKFEVTQGEWRRVTGTTLLEQRDKATAAATNKKPRSLHGAGEAFPMNYISYEEATDFCAKLTTQEQQAGRLPTGWIYTLPTEAQWEYACRAGTSTATAMGNSLESTQANFDGKYPYNSSKQGEYKASTAPVGSYPANAWGLCDMHGNVWEMCLDRYPHHLPGGSDPVTTEIGVKSESRIFRVARGGCWRWLGHECRSASRATITPEQRGSVLGVRIALVPPSS